MADDSQVINESMTHNGVTVSVTVDKTKWGPSKGGVGFSLSWDSLAALLKAHGPMKTDEAVVGINVDQFGMNIYVDKK